MVIDYDRVIIIIIDNDDDDSDSDSNIFTKNSHHIDWGIRMVFIRFYFLTDGDEPIGKTMSCYIWHFKVGDFGQRSSAFVFHRWEESYKSWLHKKQFEKIWKDLNSCPVSNVHQCEDILRTFQAQIWAQLISPFNVDNIWINLGAPGAHFVAIGIWEVVWEKNLCIKTSSTFVCQWNNSDMYNIQ